MKLKKKAILELKQNINPYLPFLYDWLKHKHCSISDDEISVINFQIKNNFKLNSLQYFSSLNNVKTINRIVAKLIWDYQKFKVWIITKFVFSLLKLAGDNNFNDLFYHLPLDYTSIPHKIKNNLKLFKVETFYQFFEKYTEQDLYTDAVFNNIVQFEVVSKYINQKTISL